VPSGRDWRGRVRPYRMSSSRTWTIGAIRFKIATDETVLQRKPVAYRILGSTAEAEDAVQKAWLRLARSPEWRHIVDLRALLTTEVARICLKAGRQGADRCEEALDGQVHLPDPLVSQRAHRGP
jgi:RNA polymerase sigma-70 factor, ECF subfamily